MSALATSLLVSAFVFGGGVLGLHLHRIMLGRQVSQETQDVVRLGTGMLSVLASLVLGLLIATVKTSFDTTDAAVRTYSAGLIVLDETLRDYGDGAIPARRLLREYTVDLLHNIWPEHGASPFLRDNRQTGELMEHVRESIRALVPTDAGQRWLMEQALQNATSLLQQRWLMIERAGPSVRPIVVDILVAWIVAIFLSFGMNAPRNVVVHLAFAICALAIGSSIFIVLQYDSPFAGVLRISSQPVRSALTHMLPEGG